MPAVQSIEAALVAKLADLPADKQQEVLDFASSLGSKSETLKVPKKSLLGILKHTGFTISAEEIDEARKEMWGNFPREHFFDDQEPPVDQK